MMTGSSGPAAPRLAEIRSRWLSAVVSALEADEDVAGAALVGSLGTGGADDWSDVDLLVTVHDAVLDGFASFERLPAGPGRRAFGIDARHNGPRGTRALSAQYVVDSLPLWVDWHVHPVSLAHWPSDSSVLFDRFGTADAGARFSEYLARGGYETATPKSNEDTQAIRLALIPLAGKQLARRSPEAARTIEFLGAPYEPSAAWEAQLGALRGLLDAYAALRRPESRAAAHAYLDLLEEILSAAPEQP